MKNKIIFAFTSIFFVLSFIMKVYSQEQATLNDNYRVYEIFNLSESKNISLIGDVNFDFTSSNPNGNVLSGIYNGKYKLKNLNSGNSTLKLGFSFTSSIEMLKDFSLKLPPRNPKRKSRRNSR